MQFFRFSDKKPGNNIFTVYVRTNMLSKVRDIRDIVYCAAEQNKLQCMHYRKNANKEKQKPT